MSAHDVELDDQIRHRFTVLTWAVGIIAALMIAMLGNTITMSYDLFLVNSRLDAKIASFVGAP